MHTKSSQLDSSAQPHAVHLILLSSSRFNSPQVVPSFKIRATNEYGEYDTVSVVC